ncbi:MAG TPA: penicillin-binding transpeptidase domain-containing protein [Solirubrobacteraceae bacterium]|jgi:penicillin-binding protein 2|nr:penicillin-binding transpeptidase domain-containing protein [Solirubrobacteraceae bacterium]
MSAIERGSGAEPRIPISPQLALRVAIIGGVAMVMFGVIFFRLWYLQVLSGEQYVHQADVNQVRDLPIAAPRGQILDREGQPIVTSRTTNAVQIVPRLLPAAVSQQVAAYEERLAPAETAYQTAVAQLAHLDSTLAAQRAAPTAAQRRERRRLGRLAQPPQVAIPALPRSAAQTRSLFRRLGGVVGLSARTIDERVVQGMTATPYANVTVKTDAGTGPLTVLAERQNEFPGVVQQPVSIRSYNYGEMAAQVLGHVDQVSPEELKLPAFRGVKQGTVVGQEGLEFYYDRYLRGKPGVERVEVNASGAPVPKAIAPSPPTAGHSLKLTLDLGLQKESEKALLQGIENARAGGKPAVAGAFTAIDPRNGEVLAIGSYPTFNPNRFAKPLTPNEYKELIGGGSASGPLTDRAVNGAYPTGSTFKPITAMATLEAGIVSPSEGLGAGQCISVNIEQFCNAGHVDFGAVGLVNALKVSSDTYFFEAGERANAHGAVIQRMAHKLGLGQETGIDLPTELKGVVPDARWRQEENAEELRCERKRHVASCGIVSEVRPWSVGDNMHLAVGQGDLLTNPLQMAVAYSTLANGFEHGGEATVVRPHLGREIDESGGGLVQSLPFPARRHVHLNYADLSLVMEGIHEAASQPGGTSADVWSGWNQAQHPVYGKTGTAERYGKEDQSWYMAYIPDPKRPIVIAVTVEEGGFGAETAAPIARLMAAQHFGQPERFVAGSSHTL